MGERFDGGRAGDAGMRRGDARDADGWDARRLRSVRRENRVESSTKGDTLFPVRAPRESSRVEYEG